MAVKRVETNIVFTLAQMLKRRWPEGAKTVDGWIEGMEKIQRDEPRIGDLVVVFDRPENWNIGLLGDCKDIQLINGGHPVLRWKLKGSMEYFKNCRRLRFSDLNSIVGFALEEIHEEEKRNERN